MTLTFLVSPILLYSPYQKWLFQNNFLRVICLLFSGPHTLNTEDAQMAGSIGKTMKGVETRIDPETKEICLQGRHVMMG